MSRIKVVGIGGSFSANSNSLIGLRAALEGAAAAGADVDLMDVKELNLPMFDYAVAPTPGARRLIDACTEAHGFIWCSPLYQGTISGAFKNALDWLELLAKREPPYLAGKVVGMVATSAGTQALQAINTMEFIARALRAWSVPFVLPVSRAHEAFDKQGRVVDEKVKEQLSFLGREVVIAAKQLASVPVPPDGPSNT
jgi:FMN reductase